MRRGQIMAALDNEGWGGLHPEVDRLWLMTNPSKLRPIVILQYRLYGNIKNLIIYYCPQFFPSRHIAIMME